jgi:hypothetical protein
MLGGSGMPAACKLSRGIDEYFRVFWIVLMQSMASLAGQVKRLFSGYRWYLVTLAVGEAFRYLQVSAATLAFEAPVGARHSVVDYTPSRDWRAPDCPCVFVLKLSGAKD